MTVEAQRILAQADAHISAIDEALAGDVLGRVFPLDECKEMTDGEVTELLARRPPSLSVPPWPQWPLRESWAWYVRLAAIHEEEQAAFDVISETADTVLLAYRRRSWAGPRYHSLVESTDIESS